MNNKPESVESRSSRRGLSTAGILGLQFRRCPAELHGADSGSHRLQELNLAQRTSFG
jgi:hypothetical protein